jgi:hypothetical protein
MRSLVPADTLVYLETNDLAGALQPIIDSESFKAVAKSQPDLSALTGIQVAVTVSGFEMTEEKLTDEHSVGRVQPRFVAIADTHAWNWQAIAFAENKIGAFVMDIYRSDVSQDRTDKNGGTWFTWTANDGRKAFAFVTGSLIYFGNDESAIEKCLSVKRGETDSIVKAGKVTPADSEILASGYVSPDGVAQIANIAGLQFASSIGDDPDSQSAIAGILPQLLRNSISDITWAATKTKNRIEDKYTIGMPPEIANVFSETIAPGDGVDRSLIEMVPSGVPIVTAYNLKSPQIALRSILLMAQKMADPLGGMIIGTFSEVLFEPYGIQNIEMFLSSVGTTLITLRNDKEGENPAIIAKVHNQKTTEESVSNKAKPLVAMENGDRLKEWEGDGSKLKVAFVGGNVISGENSAVDVCLREGHTKRDPVDPGLFGSVNAAITTVGRDDTSTIFLFGMLAGEGHGETKTVSTYITETRFTKTGVERRTISDFGLIGQILANLASEQ